MKWPFLVALYLGLPSCTQVEAEPGKKISSPAQSLPPAVKANYTPLPGKVEKSEAEWRKQLTPEQFKILRKQGTERAFANKYNDNHAAGVYRCAACGQILYFSDAKYDSGTGWPSFFTPAFKQSLATKVDDGIFGTRTEVVCNRCGGHLGHVFDDGPAPTGLRYCMNSAAMTFEPVK